MSEIRAVYQVQPSADLSAAPHAQSAQVGLGGLRALDGRVFPLERVQVRTFIAGPCARSVVEQHFVNPFDDTLDVTWIFPLPSDGAIVALELRAGDIVVVGECRKRDAALQAFERARVLRHRAALLESEQRGVHTLSLTGVPPRTAVTVQLTIVELLPVVDSRFRFQFPVTIAPRYTPGSEWGHSGFGTSPDTDAVPNASRLSPPIRLSGGTTLDLEVEIVGPVSAISSSLHAVTMSLESGSVRVAPSSVTTLDRDFILEFASKDSSSVAARAYTDGTYTVAIIEPPVGTLAPALPRDAVFVVDISGSMQGAKLEAAKAALMSALHGLQHGDRFRVLAFDERVEQFDADFRDYTDDNLHAADAWIAALEARGGTGMLEAIQQSLAGDTAPSRLRTVLFITDGQSTDEARLLPAVAHRRGNALFFTLGIDTAVNAALLKQLAQAGGGVCELCTPSDDIDGVVARLETRFGSPVLTDLSVPGSARPGGQTVFAGRPAVLLIEGASDALHVTGRAHSGAFESHLSPQHIGFSLGPLWARERVSWLEERLALRPFEEESIKPEIERIALEHRIASKFTSFVCVDQSATTDSARRHVVQPVEMPEAWEDAMYDRPMVAYSMSTARMRISSPTLSERISTVRKLVRRQPDAPVSAPVSAPPSANMTELAGTLARTQGANGSYRNDVGRSAAALLVLLLLSMTRHKGDRRRVVVKLATWLELHRDDPRAVLALDALDAAEQSQRALPTPQWQSLVGEGPEGAMLAKVLP